jgi:release factor glutamine methyltransferase
VQLREALKAGLKTLAESLVPSPQLAAELLLMHVLGCDRSYLYAYPEVELSEEIASRYFRSVAERATGKPTQYITGHQEFWGLDFEVTPDVLIPRPETEHVVEAVIDLARRQGFDREAPLRLVDVGTGSGCIALALAAEFPRASLFATDVSRPALEVASRNAARLGMAERVTFLESDLLGCFLEARAPGQGLNQNFSFLGAFDFVVSNPPYVAADELDSVQREVREFEPRIAWGGLERSDEVYRRLVPQARAVLRPGGWLIVEIGYNMGETIPALLGDGWTEIEVRPDLAGIPRVVVARRVP